MQASDNLPNANLFKRSVLAWRKSYLAKKLALQQTLGEETAAETAEVVPTSPRIVRPGQFALRKAAR